MRIFVCVFLSCLLFACADLEKSDQLKRVNNLLENVDSLLIVLNQINEPQLSREIEENNKLLSDLTMRASDDTLVETEARLVGKYANYISKLSSLKIRMENWAFWQHIQAIFLFLKKAFHLYPRFLIFGRKMAFI